MSELESNPERRIALFQRKEIRRVFHNNEWGFVVMEVIIAPTDSVNPSGYFTAMRRRDPQWGGLLSPLPSVGCGHAKMESMFGGRMCARQG